MRSSSPVFEQPTGTIDKESFLERLLRSLDRFLPVGVKQGAPLSLRRARIFIGISLATVSSTMSLAIIVGLIHGFAHGGALFAACFGLLYSLNILLFYRTSSVLFGTLGLMLVGLSGSTYSIFVPSLGFPAEPLLFSVSAMPLFALLMLDVGWSLIFGLLAALEVVAYYYFASPAAGTLGQDSPNVFVNLSVVLLFGVSLYALGWLYISSSRRSWRALQSALDALEESNRELLEARDIARQANLAKSRFLANMSHEIRTPLNAIIGYSELLSEELEETEPTLQQDADNIGIAGQKLLYIVNDILDLSKIEAGKMDITPASISMAPFLDELVQSILPLKERHNNKFTLKTSDDLDGLYTDPLRLRQCLFNLLGNAFKFTHKGHVTLDISSYEHPETSDGKAQPWIAFRIVDTGIGMTEEQRERIFQEFAQASEETVRRYGGTGLGLTITHKLCEMMGGRIECQSELGRGSTFTLILPHLNQPPSAGTD